MMCNSTVRCVPRKTRGIHYNKRAYTESKLPSPSLYLNTETTTTTTKKRGGGIRARSKDAHTHAPVLIVQVTHLSSADESEQLGGSSSN